MDISDILNVLQSVEKKNLSSKERNKALWANPKKPNQKERELISYILPFMNTAIKKAENDKRYGVRSINAKSPLEANRILNNSVKNNLLRWIQAGKPGKFVDFMRDRWAPLNADNDPNNLNYNWAPNVRGFLKSTLGQDDYNKWKKMDLVNIIGTINTMRG